MYAATNASSAPVLFFVHGGSYVRDSSGNQRFNGTFLAQKYGIVVVTINYRLSVYGFLGGAQLRHRSPDGSTGNYAVQDQREALRWCAKNIRAFGGDPERISLMGQSAGAGAVSVHLTNPQHSTGLFQRAILEVRAPCPWTACTGHDVVGRSGVEIRAVLECVAHH